MAAKFFPAPEVEKIARELIDAHHQHLRDLGVRVRYVFSDKTPKSHGKEVWGTCRKVTGLTAHLEGGSPDDDPFFCIAISKDVWDLLPRDKRVALVDHELCHAWAEAQQNEEDDGAAPVIRTTIKPHDLEEFSCIVRRHGLWREDVEQFVNEALRAKGRDEVDRSDKEDEE